MFCSLSYEVQHPPFIQQGFDRLSIIDKLLNNWLLLDDTGIGDIGVMFLLILVFNHYCSRRNISLNLVQLSSLVYFVFGYVCLFNLSFVYMYVIQ